MNLINKHILNHPVEIRDHPTDHSILREVYENDEYSVREIRKVHEKLGGCIVDVGAHIGVFTAMCAGFWPDAKIFSIEAHPLNFDLLSRNTGSLSNVKIFNGAVGYGDCNMKLHLEDNLTENTGGSTVSECIQFAGGEAGKPSGSIEVEQIKISGLVERYAISEISLLKLDCESGEYSAINDLHENDMLKNVCWIRGEYHLSDDWCINALDRMVSQMSKTHEVSVNPSADGSQGLGLFVAHRK